MTWLSRHAKPLLIVYLVLLAWALLSPESTHQSGWTHWVTDVLQAVGFPDSLVTYNRMEVVMNAVIVAPAAFLASLWRPHYSWRDWTALGFALSLSVEILQGLVLPGREATYSDVVANTAGAFLGAVLARFIASRRGRRGLFRRR